MYNLVEFKEGDGGGVAVVNRSWLTPRKQEVFCPPVKDQRQFDEIVKGADVDSSWKVYEIQRCLYETDDFEKAQKKLKQCEVTSDLQSDVSTNCLPQKRKKIPKRRLYASSDEEPEPIIERLPRLKNKLNEDIPSIAEEYPNLSYKKFLPSVLNPLAETQTSHVNAGLDLNETSRSTTSVRYEDLIFEKKILIMKSSHCSKKNLFFLILTTNIINDLPVKLPINCDENLKILENYIIQKDKLNSLSTYFSTLGARDVASKTNRILKCTLSDSLACKFNFYGKRSEKKAFYDLSLRTAIVDAVKLSSSQATEKQIEDYIKIWLKHAPERLKQRTSKAGTI